MLLRKETINYSIYNQWVRFIFRIVEVGRGLWDCVWEGILIVDDWINYLLRNF